MESSSFDVFLAHNGDDKVIVEQVARLLQDAGLRPWLDSWYIAIGDSFIKKMGDALMQSKACAFFIGPHGPGKWDQEEANLALHRAAHDEQFSLIPILLPGLADPLDPNAIPPFLRTRNRVDLRTGLVDPHIVNQLVEAVARAVRRSGPAAPDPAIPVRPDSPRPFKNGGMDVTPAISHSHRTDAASDPAPVLYLPDNVDILQGHVRDLAFTPVIGPGCSLIGRQRGPAWVAMSGQINALLRALKDEPEPSRYLRSLATLRIYDVDLRLGTDVSEPSPDDALARMQLELARVGSRLGALFASTMLASAVPVWDTLTFKLTIDRDDPGLREVQQHLVDAAIAAFRVKQKPEWKDPTSGLGSAGLYDRIVQFAAQMIGRAELPEPPRESNPIERIRQDVFEDIEKWRRASYSRHDREINAIELSIYQLEWVADALWHTLRFDKAAYPRADELAFQISLLASGVFSRRMELPTAAQLAHVMLAPSTVAAWFRKYEHVEAPPKMHEFYDSLAKILLAQYNGFKSHASSEAPSSGGALQGFQAVAFSTNFDLEMERALARAPGIEAFHVLVPVNAYFPDEPVPDLEWLFGTVERGGDVEQPFWQWFAADRMPVPSEIEGPIVVRLHGSPLQRLPKPERLGRTPQFMPSYERFEHATVMSEREYLQNIVWKDPLPKFVNMILLQKSRVLFFLGHFLDEWNTRLRLYSQVRRQNEPATTAKRVAISRSHDPYRSAVLSGIGIQRWIGDLEEVAKAVDDVLP